MDGMDYCEECEKEHREEIKNLKEQLKRKEQECEELNADNIYLRDRVGKLERAILRRNEQIDQLKAENDKLRFPMKDTNYAVLTKEEFEQLDQLKKEKAELEKQLESTKGLVTVGNKQLAEALKKNEELKTENNTYKSSIVANLDKSISKRYKELLEENDLLKETNEDLKNAYARLNALYNDNCNFTGKLEETLTEIKEIACDGYNNGQTSYATLQCEKIINIINEVENGNIQF